jgi:hypothetical protein
MPIINRDLDVKIATKIMGTGELCEIPAYSTDLNLVALIEDAVIKQLAETRGIQLRDAKDIWLDALEDLLLPSVTINGLGRGDEFHSIDLDYACLHATAEQRCTACLMALGEKA